MNLHHRADIVLPSLLDVCRCPKCDGPMTARNGPRGPYFHCLCYERALKSETRGDPTPATGQKSQTPEPVSVPTTQELAHTPG
jgi:hypothetical protein